MRMSVGYGGPARGQASVESFLVAKVDVGHVISVQRLCSTASTTRMLICFDRAFIVSATKDAGDPGSNLRWAGSGHVITRSMSTLPDANLRYQEAPPAQMEQEGWTRTREPVLRLLSPIVLSQRL